MITSPSGHQLAPLQWDSAGKLFPGSFRFRKRRIRATRSLMSMTGRSTRVVRSRQPDAVASRGNAKWQRWHQRNGVPQLCLHCFCVNYGRTCGFPRLVPQVNISETRRWNALHRDLLVTVTHQDGGIKTKLFLKRFEHFLENEAKKKSLLSCYLKDTIVTS
jgi:hypothetical protein